MAVQSLLIASGLFLALNADMYMHMPRGSNNRLNEASANRDNANRLFDSQNNNRGGYNAGDLCFCSCTSCKGTDRNICFCCCCELLTSFFS